MIPYWKLIAEKLYLAICNGRVCNSCPSYQGSSECYDCKTAIAKKEYEKGLSAEYAPADFDFSKQPESINSILNKHIKLLNSSIDDACKKFLDFYHDPSDYKKSGTALQALDNLTEIQNADKNLARVEE